MTEMKLIALCILPVFLILITLSGCGVLGGGSPTALPTVVLGSSNNAPQATSSTPSSSSSTAQAILSGGVSASGIVVPARQAQMASGLGGTVQSVDVAVGDAV